MSDRKQCDFCGEIPHSRDPRHSVEFHTSEGQSAHLELPYDLCRYCFADLRAEVARKAGRR